MIRSVHIAGFVVALLSTALAVACSSDEEGTGAARVVGAEGESCTAKADCADMLSCINNVCVSTGATLTADGGDASVTVVVSQQGESCAARSDCALGLVCINNVCVSPSQVVDSGVQTGVGQRGESCSTHSDCASGLGCYNGQCGPSNYGITPTGKQCVAVACKVPKDCCPAQASAATCMTYQTLCAQDTIYCTYYKENCACDGTAYACANDQCTTACAGDGGSTCTTGQVCDGTQCVGCLVDQDCLSSTQKCMKNQCITPCTKDNDCGAYFQTCDMGTCKDTGCKTDRECVAYGQNVSHLGANALLAKCDMTTTKCRFPCQADADCGGANTTMLQVCGTDGYCTDAGCDTDEECSIRLGLLHSNLWAACRAKTP